MSRDLAKAIVVTVMYVVVSWQCMNSFLRCLLRNK
jgi:hypothetical protein